MWRENIQHWFTKFTANRKEGISVIIDQVDQGAPYVWIIVKEVTSHKDLSDEKPKEKQKAGKSPHADSQEEKLLGSTAFWSVQRKAEKNKGKSKEMPTFSLDLCSWIFSDSDQS